MELTYEQLFDALRREKSRDELQTLEPGFYQAAQALLDAREDEVRRARALTAAGQRMHLEYQNARRNLRELYDRRERKIMTLAMHKIRADAAVIDTDTLLPEERELFDGVLRVLMERRAALLREVESVQERPRPVAPPPVPVAAPAAAPPKTVGGVPVRFLASVPKFVGKDLTVFGPYAEGATATLPEDVASILIKKGRAARASTS